MNRSKEAFRRGPWGKGGDNNGIENVDVSQSNEGGGYNVRIEYDEGGSTSYDNVNEADINDLVDLHK